MPSGIDLANWLKLPVLAAKYPRGVFLRKNGSLSKSEHRGFINFAGRLGLSKVLDYKGGLSLEKSSDISSVTEVSQNCDRKNRENELICGTYSC